MGPLPSEPHDLTFVRLYEDGTGGGRQAEGLRKSTAVLRLALDADLSAPTCPPGALRHRRARGLACQPWPHTTAARPCSSSPFLFLCYHFEKMEHDLLSLFKKCC